MLSTPAMGTLAAMQIDIEQKVKIIMIKFIRIVGILIISIVTLQLTSFYFIGKRRIHIVSMKSLEAETTDIKNVGIFTSIDLSNAEKQEIREALKFEVIEFTADSKEFSERFRHNINGYGMDYRIDKLNCFTADITELNGTLYYGEVWKSKFIWILFGWVQVKNEKIGLS
jgi:hypothetical protein